MENHPFIRGNTPQTDPKSKRREKERERQRQKLLKSKQDDDEKTNTHYCTRNWGGDKHLEPYTKHKSRNRGRDRRIIRDRETKHEPSNTMNHPHQIQPRHSLPILTKSPKTNINTTQNKVNNDANKNEIVAAHMSMNTKSNKANNGSNINKISSCFPGISAQNSPPPQLPNYQQVSKQSMYIFK